MSLESLVKDRFTKPAEKLSLTEINSNLSKLFDHYNQLLNALKLYIDEDGSIIKRVEIDEKLFQELVNLVKEEASNTMRDLELENLNIKDV